MRIIISRISLVTLLLTFVLLAGGRSLSDSNRSRYARQKEGPAKIRRPTSLEQNSGPLSYRSPGAKHKLVVPAGDAQIYSRIISTGQARRVRKYGSYTLFEIDDAALGSLDARELERTEVRDDWNLIKLRRGQIDTTGAEPLVNSDMRQPDALARSLHLVQLAGPPTTDSLGALKTTGAKVISYVPNNAYLIWASPNQIARVREIREQSGVIQWDGPFHPAYRIAPGLRLDSAEQIAASIEIVDAAESNEAIWQIKALARRVIMPEFRASGTIQLKILVESFRLKEVARLACVISVEPWANPRLHDERVNQIVAGTISQESINSIIVGRPTRPGFMTFLSSLGFNSNFDFAVDVSDTGFDLGSEDTRLMHEDFLDPAGASRIAYLYDHSSDGAAHPENLAILPVHDALGHGTINASIIGGFNTKTGSGYVDSLGFQYGQGVAPFARIGVSKVFDDNGGFAQGAAYTDIVSAAYRGGARVSSNSWGLCDLFTGNCNLYGQDARAYDFLVRDADPDSPGNQSMTILFSSGNDGFDMPNSISSPGTAKNVITVGATEGFRVTDANGQPVTDGCGVPGFAADNAYDIIGFSSGGPVWDGRAKPDLVAPGSHIVGAASQDSFFKAKPEAELEVCDRYFPAGQTVYTWSSGTSHSTPIVAGGAALAYQWLRARSGAAPSPALVKALLLNSTSYVTGHLGGDSLPGKRQGWGLLNLSRTFEATDRVIYDESDSRTFTQSGGAPFEITGVITDPSKEFRVMLTWSDAAGSSTTNAPYVNQINLEVIVGGVVYNGNHFSGQYSTAGSQKDIFNNVQGVRLSAGVTGPFVIRVRPMIIAGDGVPGNTRDLDQDFALVVTNGREAAVPVLTVRETAGISTDVSVRHQNGSTDSSLIPGETASISVRVFNESNTEAATVSAASLALAGGGSAISSYPAIEAAGSANSLTAFQIQIPSDTRCGSVIEFQLRLQTQFGQVTLPVRLEAGRPENPDAPRLALDDDVDSNRVVWKFKKGFSVATGIGKSGASSYRAVDPGKDEDDFALASMTLKKKITIPATAGRVRLTFFHIFNFEPGFDGGVAEISADGGATWEDLGLRFISGGYDGVVTTLSENPLGNRLAWTARGQAGVFSPVVINLDDFAGKKITLRFLAGFDFATGVRDGYTGWFIDDVRISYVNFACR
jgi:subtilase family protein